MVKKSFIWKSCIALGAIFFCLQVSGVAQENKDDDLGQTLAFYDDLFLHPSWEVLFSPDVEGSVNEITATNKA